MQFSKPLGKQLTHTSASFSLKHHKPPRVQLAVIRHANSDGKNILQLCRIRPRPAHGFGRRRLAGFQKSKE